MGDRRVKQYPAELRERAVRMVLESSNEYESQWKAITSIAPKLGIGSSETLRKWVRDAEAKAGGRPAPAVEDSAELKRLRRENLELKRANDILKAAAGFFAAELCATRRSVCRGVVEDHPRWVVAAA
jgi:transposase